MAQPSFRKRPEGVAGTVVLLALLAGGGLLLYTFRATLAAAVTTTLGAVVALTLLGMIGFALVEPRTRATLGYLYRAAVRGLTGLFVNVDPIAILQNYVGEMEANLGELRRQIGKLRGQIRHLTSLTEANGAEIANQLRLAEIARERGRREQVVLGTRRAARLRESNAKYAVLLQRMDVLRRVLDRMHANSEVLLADTRDQVELRLQERRAIRASHSAMSSAMSVINGDPDRRARFDRALEAVAEDVAGKVGEMERMMDLSRDFLDNVDLQNGVFTEEGLRLLEDWEARSELRLHGGKLDPTDTLDLDELAARPRPEHRSAAGGDAAASNYDHLF